MSDPKPDQHDRSPELPGDTNSADIVGPTGEQMPVQSHDGLETEKRGRGDEDNRSDNQRPAPVADYGHE